MTAPTIAQLVRDNEDLRRRLEEAEDALRALGAGEVDAVLVSTDREQVYTLEAAHRAYQLMVDQIQQPAASFTTDGVILHGNHRFASLLARPLDALVGKSIYSFLAEESLDAFRALLRAVQAAEVQATEVKFHRGDGSMAPAYLGISALQEGPLGTCLIATDLTDQRSFTELKLAQEALREADRRKNEFVAILAHELRNPLGPIRNAARILKLKGPRDPELRSPIEMIERQTEQLARLLDDLLDVSRITRGALEMRPERFTFTKVVVASVDACHEVLQEHGVCLNVSLPADPFDLVADRARLIQVLCNLITNAAKYTPAGGHIALVATVTGGTLVVSVKDNGIGIPRERLADIFELFAQVDRSTERAGGLGIGLTLVRQIATLHGGSIEARSGGVGQGSEFILTLPLPPAAIEMPAAFLDPITGSGGGTRRILVVDDNRDAAESLTELLQISGHDVQYALGGEAAVALASEGRPDAVLLDLGMPGVSGYDVARRIREQPWGKRIYLVALSGWGQPEARLRTQEAGFDAHLVKPVAPEALSRLLDSMSVGPADSNAR